jgi:tetratricopeptide (TPR) repeat protein
MYDIKLLEEEWEKYQKKKRKPYIIMGALILLLAGGIVVLYYTKGIDFIVYDKNTTKQKIEKKPLIFIENKSLEKLEVKQAKQQEVLESPDEIVEDLPLSDDNPIRKKPRVKMNIVTTEMPTVKKKRVAKEEKTHKRKHLTIKKTSGSSAYKEVAERFRETQDTDDSLFLARTYYNMKQYKKAEYWALQTNNINSNIEESILIFAKTKVKLGHKNEAIRILSKYIKGSDSMEAKILLEKIKKGKL